MAISRRSEGVAVGQERVGHEKIGSGCTTSPSRSEPQEKGWSCGHIHERGRRSDFLLLGVNRFFL
jgi:hypothetical protein